MPSGIPSSGTSDPSYNFSAEFTNADIISRNCSQRDNPGYVKLKANADTIFTRIFSEDKWRLELLYFKKGDPQPESVTIGTGMDCFGARYFSQRKEACITGYAVR